MGIKYKIDNRNQSIRATRAGYRPNMPVCILLADHWGINPNELLMLAGWPTLKAFDIHTESAANLPPQAVEVAVDKQISLFIFSLVGHA